ncbi:MAG: signal peptidase [Propionibacterium sp.]|nr:MAG: signal peptidase [Propionibacterium sp.]
MTISKIRFWPIWVAIWVFGYLADLVTKFAAVSYLDPNDPPVLLGGLVRLQLMRNPGAAFSMGTQFTILLSVFAVVVFFAILLYFVPRITTKFQAVVAGMFLAGITGNLTDRIFRSPGPMRGHVVDMIQVPYFAIFNVADMFITVAAVLLFIVSLRSDSSNDAKSDGAESLVSGDSQVANHKSQVGGDDAQHTDGTK